LAARIRLRGKRLALTERETLAPRLEVVGLPQEQSVCGIPGKTHCLACFLSRRSGGAAASGRASMAREGNEHAHVRGSQNRSHACHRHAAFTGKLTAVAM